MESQIIAYQLAWLKRIRRNLEFEFAAATLNRDNTDDLRLEWQRLTVQMRVLGEWLQELRLAEQGREAVAEVERILAHSEFFP